jgi:membrane fusion protein (multidrug efflux system)
MMRFHPPLRSKRSNNLSIFTSEKALAFVMTIVFTLLVGQNLSANEKSKSSPPVSSPFLQFSISPRLYPVIHQIPLTAQEKTKPSRRPTAFKLLQAPVSPPLSPLRDEQMTPSNPHPTTIPTEPPNTPPTPKSTTSLDYPISIVLSPLHKAVLSSQLATDVIRITKKMGDPFAKGEVLILLNNRVFKAKVQKAEAIVARARHVLSVKQQLYQDRVASSVEIADTKASLDVAIAELAVAQKDLSDTIIKAPFPGNVVDVYIEENEMVQPGQKLIAIVDSSTLVAKMLVPSIYLKDLYIGQPIQLRIRETHELIEAKITQIGVVIDPASSMLKVFAEIDNRDRKLTAGMIGTAKIEKLESSPKQPPKQPPATDHGIPSSPQHPPLLKYSPKNTPP